MPKKTAPPDQAEPMAEAHAQDVEVDLTPEGIKAIDKKIDELDAPVTGDADGGSEGEPDTGLVEVPEPVFTPVHAMEQFEAAMHEYPNSCLKHMLAEWKSQEREARKFEERQRVRGDIP